MGIGGEIILLLALLKDQQKGLLAGIEPLVLQSFLDKLRLTGIQEAGISTVKHLCKYCCPSSTVMSIVLFRFDLIFAPPLSTNDQLLCIIKSSYKQ